MEKKTVGLIAAMPNETRPLLKCVGYYEKTALAGFPFYRFNTAGKQCLLIESGIGSKRAERAASALIASWKPQLLISFGFGGAVKPGASVGDIVLAGKSMPFEGDRTGMARGIDTPFPRETEETLRYVANDLGFAVMGGNVITADTILNKNEVAEALPQDLVNPVLDMETWAVARIAAREKITLLAVRAISDACGEELGFRLEQFLDSDMNISPSRVFLTIVRKPWIIPQLLRLAGNSKIAGINLAASLETLLAIDP